MDEPVQRSHLTEADGDRGGDHIINSQGAKRQRHRVGAVETCSMTCRRNMAKRLQKLALVRQGNQTLCCFCRATSSV